jgi:cell wall-associated NlpC family hydrolase
MKMTKLLVVCRNVANLYAAADTNSEVVSQALLGETLTVQDKQGDFYFVRTVDDFYSGWIRAIAVAQTAGDITGYTYRPIGLTLAEVYAQPNAAEEIITRLPLGSRVAVLPERIEAFQRVMLPDLSEGWVLRFALGGMLDVAKLRRTNWAHPEDRSAIIDKIGEDAVAVGRRLIGTPYLWGGKSAFGIDCSGFTQLCYRYGGGIQLLRDARLQFADPRFAAIQANKTLKDKPKFQDGDLLFFGKEGRVTHVGMAAQGRIMHSAGGIGTVWQRFDELSCANEYLGARRLSKRAKTLVASAA